MRDSIIDYCVRIGTDPLLVQGASGNISWKDSETLWIKASGTCLAEADRRDIFIAVDLAQIQTAIINHNFDVQPLVLNGGTLRPSIETLLHAIMPFKVVVHLHAINTLAHMVRTNALSELAEKIGTELTWEYVDYYKPGRELAIAVYDVLKLRTDVRVVFLQNHGLIIGGDNIQEVEDLMDKVNHLLDCELMPQISLPAAVQSKIELNSKQVYNLVPNAAIQQLALNSTHFSRLSSTWALSPDQVVFLGPNAYCFNGINNFKSAFAGLANAPKVIFIKEQGVYCLGDYTSTLNDHLLCYAAVISRQSASEKLRILKPTQVSELLNWDAEIYRQNMEKA